MFTDSIRISLFPATAMLALTLCSAAAAQFPQPEPCITQTAGVIDYGQHVCGAGGSGLASLSPVGHIEIFSFHYDAGEAVWFQGYTSGSLDLRLRVLDPANGFAVVASNSVSGNAANYPYSAIGAGLTLGLSPSLNLATGDYLVEVSDSGANETGSYSLSLQRITPAFGPILQDSTLITDTISPKTDVDILGFHANQGSLLNVFLRTHGCLDLAYRIYDSSGTLVKAEAAIAGNASNYPYSCISQTVNFNPFATSTNSNAPAPATGLYWIVLRDSGVNETGTYSAQVQCLFSPGGCPSTPASFALQVTQPAGSGSIALDVVGGVASAPYITAFSFNPVNAGAPHTGWFGGLHVSFPELGAIMSCGFPFIGFLDANGESTWASAIPAGPLPPIYMVTVQMSPGFQGIVTPTPIVTANLL